MAMFGKTSDEIKTLHTLKDFIDIGKKDDNGLCEGAVRVLGKKADNTHIYDYEIDYRHFKFDKENIYLDGRVSSLKEIMKDAVINKEMADKYSEKLSKIGLSYGDSVKVGESISVIYEGESYDSTDEYFYAYTVTDEKQLEMETFGKSQKTMRKGMER